MFFHKLTGKVDIEGTLRCVTALRIGSGKDSGDVAATDLPVLKDALGRPIIPGASLKGVVRSSVEALLRSLAPEGEGDRWACDPFSGSRRCVPDPPDPEERTRMEDMTQIARTHYQRERLKRLCLACRTFGAPGYASHVLFRDARPQGRAHTERRDGVSIDRDLGRVSGGRKYDFEVVAEGSRFDFGLTIDSAEPWQEGLVVLGIEMLNEGFTRVGGATSRGLGRVAIVGLTVKALDVDALRRGDLPAGSALPLLADGKWDVFRDRALAAWQRTLKEGGAPIGA